MPSSGMTGYVGRKNTASVAQNNPPRPGMTREQAREMGLYLDPRQFSTAAEHDQRKPPSSKEQAAAQSSTSGGPSHHGFETDEPSLSLDADEVQFIKSRPRLSPLDGILQHQVELKREDLSHDDSRDVAQSRHFAPSSYPTTTTDGSNPGTPRSARGRTTVAHQASTPPRLIALPIQERASPSSARATGTVSGPPESSLPIVRVLYAPRLTVVRDQTLSQRPLEGAPSHDQVHPRPVTSRGLTQPTPVVQFVNEGGHSMPLGVHPVAKSSTLGDMSDPESSPSPAEPDSLDHPPEELRVMRFMDLRAEPVDQPVSTEADPAADLEKQLAAALRGGDRGQQTKLLESLPLERWEAAGDWFVERQAEIARRCVALRRDKRRLALALEDVIEARHLLIAEKHQLLREHLSGLREAGGRVLEVGTPKKRKM